MAIIRSFKVGANVAHILDRNSLPANHGVAESIRYVVRLDLPGGYLTDWPVRYTHYADGPRYGFDHYATKSAQLATARAFRFVDKLTKRA